MSSWSHAELSFRLYTLLGLLLLAACQGSPGMGTGSTPRENVYHSLAEATLSPALSAVEGRVLTVASGTPRPMADTVVRLAKVFYNEPHTDGVYVLDGASSPGAITDQEGRFSVVNIEPGDYVIVVGDAESPDHVIISERDGKAKLFTAEAGQTLDVGTLEVNLKTGG